MVGVCELVIYYIGLQYFHIVGYDESINGNLEIGFRVPWPVSITAAWNRNIRTEWCSQTESLRNILHRKGLGPAVVLA